MQAATAGAEAAAHRDCYASGPWRYAAPVEINEGEGDFAYLPGVRGGRVLGRLFPDAVHADEVDALAFGLNLISDGRHAARCCIAELRR